MKKMILSLLMFAMIAGVAACSKSEIKSADTDIAASDTDNTDDTEEPDATIIPEGNKQEDSTNGEEMSTDRQKNSSDKDLSQYRVVASSVAVVEILDALNIPMVGVPTSSYDLPESAAEAQRIGNPMSPDMEVILSLEPTVIISVNSLSEDLKAQFDELEIPSEFVDLSSYDGLKEGITSLGTYFGVEEKAAQLIADFESREAAITDKIAGKESPAVAIIFGASNTFMTATENTYVGDLVKRVGAVNILGDMEGSFIPVDMEFLADKNPDYILFMAHANPEESLAAFQKEFETNEAWKNFEAVQNDKVIALETGYFGMSANLLASDAMEKLVSYLYEE